MCKKCLGHSFSSYEFRWWPSARLNWRYWALTLLQARFWSCLISQSQHPAVSLLPGNPHNWFWKFRSLEIYIFVIMVVSGWPFQWPALLIRARTAFELYGRILNSESIGQNISRKVGGEEIAGGWKGNGPKCTQLECVFALSSVIWNKLAVGRVIFVQYSTSSIYESNFRRI